jgi:hypothetical protein
MLYNVIYVKGGITLTYNEELALKLYKGYIDWINEMNLEDNLDNYTYYIENIQTLAVFEKIK